MLLFGKITNVYPVSDFWPSINPKVLYINIIIGITVAIVTILLIKAYQLASLHIIGIIFLLQIKFHPLSLRIL